MSGIIELKSTSGLDLKVDTAACRLIFGAGITAPQPAVRIISEMKEVLMDSAIKEPRDLYYMYRDVHMSEDEPLLKRHNLRYDVTVIRGERLGRELMKTAGHYHPGSFGELYEVLEGEALCLLQKHRLGDWQVIEDVILVQAKAGQKIVIPPGYGHILVNPAPRVLVTSNWVSSVFSSEYELYKKAGGAAYFLIEGASKGKIEFIKNTFFKETPRIRFCCPEKKLDRFGLKEGSPIYNIIKSNPLKLDFLNHPLEYDYKDIFVDIDNISSV